MVWSIISRDNIAGRSTTRGGQPKRRTKLEVAHPSAVQLGEFRSSTGLFLFFSFSFGDIGGV